jgi:hypothetical protein
MNYIDPPAVDKPRDAANAQHTERIPDRCVKKIPGRQEVQPLLPLIGGPKGYKDLVPAELEFAAKTDKVTLGTAIASCR